ncbi:DUF3859 domain-containing protein [Desulfovibrio inopinatus]|uniref:DUF3859 domain-containing protein n=1 Tax=Desulfovibrio inopinatus TaxID=102109 RepID=UPI00041E1D1D|nr:DUF3859 domain-containing protein [Desulfovibrio inopinatus]
MTRCEKERFSMLMNACWLLCVMLIVLASGHDAYAQSALVDGVLVTESGTIAATTSQKGLGDIRFVGHASKVQASLGTGFGFRYTTSGHPDGAPIILTVALKHPPITNPATGEATTGQVYQLQSAVGRSEAEYFVFEKSYELVPGQYVWRIFNGKLPLAEQTFVVSVASEGATSQKNASPPPKPSPIRFVKTHFLRVSTMGQAAFLATEKGEFMLSAKENPEFYIQVVDVVSRLASGEDVTIYYREPKAQERYGELIGIKTPFFGVLGKTDSANHK